MQIRTTFHMALAYNSFDYFQDRDLAEAVHLYF